MIRIRLKDKSVTLRFDEWYETLLAGLELTCPPGAILSREYDFKAALSLGQKKALSGMLQRHPDGGHTSELPAQVQP